MIRALDDYVITGVKTTIPFCTFVMKSGPFRSGKYSTHFVQENWKVDEMNLTSLSQEALDRAVIVAATRLRGRNRSSLQTKNEGEKPSRWTNGRFEG
jgi:acetyl/propionyl-CoA carboxylase alpha subunit